MQLPLYSVSEAKKSDMGTTVISICTMNRGACACCMRARVNVYTRDRVVGMTRTTSAQCEKAFTEEVWRLFSDIYATRTREY